MKTKFHIGNKAYDVYVHLSEADFPYYFRLLAVPLWVVERASKNAIGDQRIASRGDAGEEARSLSPVDAGEEARSLSPVSPSLIS